jgi:GntR family transcriptional repressor for pyruvate dehydrogenase complex
VPRRPRLSDTVAETMLETILSKGLRPGDRLPSERELGGQFGVSRTVIREATRTLAARGVIEVRSGTGLCVAAVPAGAVSESMTLFLRGHGALTYAEVHEVRSMFETEVTRLAATRATEEDIEDIRRHCEAMAEVLDSVEEASKADVEFHRSLARATHNELFIVMLDSIGDVMLQVRQQTMGMPRDAELGLEAHRRIAAKVAEHDEASAVAAMRRHLEESLQTWGGLGAERISPGTA